MTAGSAAVVPIEPVPPPLTNSIAAMPRKPAIASVSSISRLPRTDLLASLIGVPAARRVMSAALLRGSARSMTAKGG